MILSTVTLRIFFYGLIAFTPSEFRCDSAMRALLIDARNPRHASDGCPIAPHTPALFFHQRNRVSCPDPCTQDRGLCRCDLGDGFLIDISENRDGACYRKQADTSTGKKVKAESDQSCPHEDFNYIPKMGSLSPRSKRMKLREDCNQACPTFNRITGEAPAICRLVAAQVNFKADSVSACRWATDHSGEVRPFDLRPLTSGNLWTTMPSIMPEVLVFTTKTAYTSTKNPVSGNTEKHVELEIISFDGNESYILQIPVVSKNGKEYAEISVANFMNDMDHDNSYPGCTSRPVARDFEIYHDLTQSPMYISDQAIPQLSERKSLLRYRSKGNKTTADNQKVADNCESDLRDLLLSSILSAVKTPSICPEVGIDG